MIKKLNFYTRFVLYGKTGVGKTTCSCTAPKPIALIDADSKATNQVNIKDKIKSGDIDVYPFPYPLTAGDNLNYIMHPDKVIGIPVGYQKFVNLIDDILYKQPKEYATIVIDSGTRIVQHLIQLTAVINKKTQMTQNLWGVFHTEMANRFLRLTNIPINMIWIFHERSIIDEITKQQIIVPSIPGSMGEEVGSYFNEVYNVRVDELSNKHYYYVVTKSNAKHSNRTSGPLLLKEEPDICKIITKLNGTYVLPVNSAKK